MSGPGQERLSLVPKAAVELIAERAALILASSPGRIVVGLAGGPGVGKSTTAADVVAALNARTPGLAAYVPMDGFHMKHQKLEALGTAREKGMPHTFEGAAFAAFLAKLKVAESAVSGPGYSRQIEDVVEDAFTVEQGVRVLVTEGNYLLLPDPPWDAVKPLLDFSVFIHVDREKVFVRLLKRHAEAGLFTEERNREHIGRVDMPNYDLVEKTAARADLRIDIVSDG
ncbi:MAG TPA: nucleoside/nucleotide kinase family protein [Devosiaceae bacterium]|nr:nucleoside/nucleotide kinase family protein [Devosiaceae bacterium]